MPPLGKRRVFNETVSSRTRKRSSQSRGRNRARADTVSLKTRLFPRGGIYCPPFTLTEGEYIPAEGMGALGFPRMTEGQYIPAEGMGALGFLPLRMLALNEWKAQIVLPAAVRQYKK